MDIQAPVNHRPQITSQDRLTMTTILAVLLHALIILGIGFNIIQRNNKEQTMPSFEFTLASTRTDIAPDDAAYLAQHNQEGGGNTSERVRAETFSTPMVPQHSPELTSNTLPAESLPQYQYNRSELLTADSARERVESQMFTSEKNADQTQKVDEVMSMSQEIASLEMELGQSIKAYSKQPKVAFITSSTREYRFASYMDAWRRKVEKTARQFFLDEVRRHRISGKLMMEVVINADGSIKSLRVNRSSGYQVLDDLALRIVREASPFARFPENIAKDKDELHIFRTFSFTVGGGISTH